MPIKFYKDIVLTHAQQPINIETCLQKNNKFSIIAFLYLHTNSAEDEKNFSCYNSLGSFGRM